MFYVSYISIKLRERGHRNGLESKLPGAMLKPHHKNHGCIMDKANITITIDINVSCRFEMLLFTHLSEIQLDSNHGCHNTLSTFGSKTDLAASPIATAKYLSTHLLLSNGSA